ncbi:MAG: 23S rRNA (guanosine(2251)-2'-O)-methyltransferase RlmB [Solirubrobacterales bacterium]
MSRRNRPGRPGPPKGQAAEQAGRERIYGRRPVAEAGRGRRRVHQVWEAPATGSDELERLCGSREHQGIVAEVDAYPYWDPAQLLTRGPGVIVALDEVQDPHNVGAVCRSAEAGGALGVVLCERRAASVTPAAVKASAGAVEHLPVARVRNLANWLADAQKAGAWIYGAAAEGTTAHHHADLDGFCVLVLGSEGRGLRPRVAGTCDALLAIPQQGQVGSLNVSAAAAVLVFEALRQRSAGANTAT